MKTMILKGLVWGASAIIVGAAVKLEKKFYDQIDARFS